VVAGYSTDTSCTQHFFYVSVELGRARTAAALTVLQRRRADLQLRIAAVNSQLVRLLRYRLSRNWRKADGCPSLNSPFLSVLLQAALQKETGRADEKLKLARRVLMRNAQTLVVRRIRGCNRSIRTSPHRWLIFPWVHSAVVVGAAGARAGARIADAISSVVGSRQRNWFAVVYAASFTSLCHVLTTAAVFAKFLRIPLAANTNDLVLVSRHGFVRTSSDELRLLLALAVRQAKDAAQPTKVDDFFHTILLQSSLEAAATQQLAAAGAGAAGDAATTTAEKPRKPRAGRKASSSGSTKRTKDTTLAPPPSSSENSPALGAVNEAASAATAEVTAPSSAESTTSTTPEASVAVSGEQPGPTAAAAAPLTDGSVPGEPSATAPAVAAPAAKARKLPPGWEAAVDVRTGGVYYIE